MCLAGEGGVRACRPGEAPIDVVSSTPGFVGGVVPGTPAAGPVGAVLVGLTGQLRVRVPHDVVTVDLVAPDAYARVIALEDGKAGDEARVLVK